MFLRILLCFSGFLAVALVWSPVFAGEREIVSVEYSQIVTVKVFNVEALNAEDLAVNQSQWYHCESSKADAAGRAMVWCFSNPLPVLRRRIVSGDKALKPKVTSRRVSKKKPEKGGK